MELKVCCSEWRRVASLNSALIGATRSGELWLYVLRDCGRFGLLRLGVRALLGRLRQSRDFEALALPELLVEDRRAELTVAVDGEVLHMATPVRYRIRPLDLRVMVPLPEPAA